MTRHQRIPPGGVRRILGAHRALLIDKFQEMLRRSNAHPEVDVTLARGHR